MRIVSSFAPGTNAAHTQPPRKFASKRRILSGSTVPIIFTALFFILLLVASLLRTYSVQLWDVLAPTASVRCVLYDRPPRTGSTTIYKSLDACLVSKGYPSSFKSNKGVHNGKLISTMLDSQGHKKSMLSRHIGFNNNTAHRLRTECHNLLYISSSRPMRERLLSKVKYEVEDAHGNAIRERANVPLEGFKKTLAKPQFDVIGTEQYYEDYPRSEGAIMPDVDYVIRSYAFVEDLSALLSALNCPPAVKEANKHTIQGDETDQSEYLAAFPIKLNDTKYSQLTAIAQRNGDGLSKAASF